MFIEDTPAQSTTKDDPHGDARQDGAPRHASRQVGAGPQSRGRFPGQMRPRSVRAKIVSVLMVPVVSLMALWGFATVTTARSVSEIQRFQEVNSTLLAPVNDVMAAVQDERSATARHLASAGDARIENVEGAGATTDAALDDLRAGVNATSTEIAALDEQLPGRIDALVQSTRDLAELRDQVIFREISWDAAYRQYTAAIEAGFDVNGGMTDVRLSGEFQDAGSDPRVVLELARAREMLSQEDAYMGAAQSAGEMSSDDYNAVVGAASARETMLNSAIDDLQPDDRASYTDVINSEVYQRLIELEQSIRQEGWGESVLVAVPEDVWRETTSAVMEAMAAVEGGASTDAIAAANPFGLDVLGGSGLAVVLGLAGVLLSLVISVQIGRGLVVDLVDLRNSAMELAGKKLPQTLRRLHTGADIDVDKEAPIQRMKGDEGEVAEVAEALNAVHRSAIQSAIERAEALNGISAVYVYLARRSQVLLHRQLALLDQMERRVDDPDELEDLFRLDHLTTRMRRLAESLIIMSGATPARGWRKPVPLIDVVRAAVAEVEDFTRVEMHDLPEIKMAGSCVADLTHLLAELIENAVVFSPPHTQAHVRGEVVGAGLALEIEDRGLGMSPEALSNANRRIEDAEQVDLLETDQLGLFVVNRLAHRHKVRATLQTSPYGGITAVVLVPDALIDRSADAGDDTIETTDSVSPQPPQVGPASRALPPARVAAPVPPPEPEVRFDGESSAWGVPWDLDGPSRPSDHAAGNGRPPVNGVPSTTGLPRSGGEEPASAAAPEPAEPVPTGDFDLSSDFEPNSDDTNGGLPKRIRQASLAPQLRDPAIPGDQEAETDDPEPQRTPDEARATMAAMRRGWLRGKDDDSSVATSSGSDDQQTDTGAQGEGK